VLVNIEHTRLGGREASDAVDLLIDWVTFAPPDVRRQFYTEAAWGNPSCPGDLSPGPERRLLVGPMGPRHPPRSTLLAGGSAPLGDRRDPPLAGIKLEPAGGRQENQVRSAWRGRDSRYLSFRLLERVVRPSGVRKTQPPALQTTPAVSSPMPLAGGGAIRTARHCYTRFRFQVQWADGSSFESGGRAPFPIPATLLGSDAPPPKR